MYRMVRITTYKPCYKQDFIRLNKQWIDSYFRLEQSDLDTFLHIDESIIGCGGQIFLAVDEKETVVGCCAPIQSFYLFSICDAVAIALLLYRLSSFILSPLTVSTN